SSASSCAAGCWRTASPGSGAATVASSGWWRSRARDERSVRAAADGAWPSGRRTWSSTCYRPTCRSGSGCDGVFVRAADGTLVFHAAPPPTDAEVQRVVERVRRRLERLGFVGPAAHDGDADPLADESQGLAGLAQAAVLGRAALGRRAGRGPLRIGADPD